MNDDLVLILMDLAELCMTNAHNIEQVAMLGVDGLTQPQKDERISILRSIQVAQDGGKKTFDRIVALRKK